MADYYRGGERLIPKTREVRIDRITGLLKTTHGISVFSRPDGLDGFGEAYRVSSLPGSLQIIQRGLDPFHHEIVPAQPMTFEEYEEALKEIVLTLHS